MSGGSAVTDRIQRRGITRPARSGRGRTGRPLDAPEAHAKGLVLTEDGAGSPAEMKWKCAGCRSARAQKQEPPKGGSIMRKGSKPHGQDRERGLGLREPGRVS